LSGLAQPVTPATDHEHLAVRLPNSLEINRRLDRWLRFSRDGYVEICSGKVEIGQGILTALAQIAAEELDVRIDQVRMIAATTTASPNEAVTSGSLSIQQSGSALRQACAEARAIYLQAAARLLTVEVATLSIDGGDIVAGDHRTSYWSLADNALLARDANGSATPKTSADYRVIGTDVARVDLPDKIFGRPCFIHDLELPDMLHGRMLRPASPSATLLSIDDGEARDLAGVHSIVRDGSLIGVLADSEAIANRAIALLSAHATWRSSTGLPDQHDLSPWLKAQPVETSVVDHKPSASHEGTPVARTLRAAYAKPYLAHGSIGPSCALARCDADRIDVWTHSQGIFNLRNDLAHAFGMQADAVAVHHVQGAGCYGHNGADDVAFDAAWLARAAEGRPVRVQWTRADELSWAPFGPAMTVELEADLGADGDVLDWRHTIWSNGHGTRPGRGSTPALLGSWYLQQPFEQPLAVDAAAAVGGGSERNAVPLYDFPAWNVIKHRVLSMPLRTSALRALGAVANVFAIESFVDEIASALDQDPIAFRLRHLQDARARAVIERVAARSSWREWQAREGRGRGIGFAKYKNSGAYCAVVAEIEAEAEVRVTRLVIAVDVGRVINPDGVANQIEGGAIQATSWALKEAVRFDAERVTSTSWDDYPILRFSEVPKVHIEIIDSDQPSVGAGEPSLGPTVAAIANAVFDALGVRVRTLPLTAERIVAASALASD
jgi:nicotinate dehydrogenase subunit B